MLAEADPGSGSALQRSVDPHNIIAILSVGWPPEQPPQSPDPQPASS